MYLHCLNGNSNETALILILPDFIAGMLISGSILIMVSLLIVFIIAMILRRDLVCVTVEHMAEEPSSKEETNLVESSLAVVAEVPIAVAGVQMA